MKPLLFLLALCILIACASNKLAPKSENLSQMQQKVPGITLEKAQQGYALYKQKCSGCHQLYAPASYTIPEWDKVLKAMFPKAKIQDEETKGLIRDYLYA